MEAVGGLGAPGRSTDAAWAQQDEAARRQLLADVAHDLRTPLAIMLALAERILAREALPHAVRRDVEAARTNAYAMLAQVEDLLRVASADMRNPAHLHPCDLARLVGALTAAFEPLAAARAVTLASDLPATLPVLADRRRMAALVTNLLSNALKFTPPGGVVRVALHGPAPRTRLEVADSGPGVPPRLRARVFGRFAQDDGEAGLRERGLGIGLAIVSDVVALHGGSVRVEDAPEGGALFVAELPLRAARAAPDHERPLEAVVRPSLERLAVELEGPGAELQAQIERGDRPWLLLVDDDRERAALQAAALEEDYRVAHVTGIDAALAQLRARPRAVALAAGAAGLELLAAVRAQPALDDVPVLVLAPPGMHGHEAAAALRAGAHDVVVGAVEPEELRARIGRALALAAEMREVRREADAAALALDAAPFPTALLGSDGAIVRAGASFCALAGRPPEELRGLTLDALSHPDDAGPDACERRLVRPDGRVVPVLLRVAAVGDPSTAVVQAQDLTAERDELTLLPRRHRFEEAVAMEAAGGGRAGARLAVVVCGIDAMHQVNRAHGRRRGDRLLCELADAMRRRLGGPERLARAGGDRFAALLPGAGEPEARALAGELLELLADVRLPGRPSLRPSASAGVALVARGGRRTSALATAEEALRRARARGGGRVVVSRG